jgi:predicted MFS family arabinose efflux permease
VIARVVAWVTIRRRPAAALPGSARKASRSSHRGLDWLNFFIANVQTGFGPFIAVYLAGVGWTEFSIGSILSVAGLVGLITQLPAGALIDAVRSTRSIAALAALAITLSALMLALWPIYPVVLTAEILHGVASSLLGPAIAAISLGLVGHRLIARRFARNARFASIGNGLAAAVMGACGFYISNRAVFFFTAALGLPTLLALSWIRPAEIDPVQARGATRERDETKSEPFLKLLRNRGLLIFTFCAALFHLANAAMLPMMGSVLTARSSQWAIVLIAASLVLPQIVVALLAPLVGDRAERWGRRPLLLIGFGTLPIRGLLFALLRSPYLLVATQLLDGISAAVFGIVSAVVVADLTRGSGHFNLGQAIVGFAIGIGASLSTILGGYVADRFGNEAAFLCLSAVALMAVAIVYVWLPETRPGGPAGAPAPSRHPKQPSASTPAAS